MVVSKNLFLALGDQLAKDITKAVTDTLEKTFAINVKAGRYMIGEGVVQLNGDVSGIVGLIQEKLEGTLTVSFSLEVVRKIIPRLLGNDIEVTRDVAIDAVSEMTNMIFGQLKTELNQRGHQVRFGLPSVVTGPGHFISHLHEGQYMIMPFEMEGSTFQVHIAIHKNPNA
jgi:chemotaxis protein CheX